MPNPGAMTSLQAFDRETISTVIHIPDYRLRQRLALQQGEPLVVEAFIAFDEMFYLHLAWAEHCNFPEVMLSSVGARYHKLVLDLSIQSPHFTYAHSMASADSPGPPGAAGQPWSLCTWATPTSPVEVHRPSSLVPLQPDRAPTYHNDVNISLDQTVTFTLAGTIWELDDNAISSLHCRSYRAGSWEAEKAKPLNTAAHMIANVAGLHESAEVPPDVTFELDAQEEGDEAVGATRMAHSFVLQAQSLVFRRMLAGPMMESKDGVIKMSGVSPAELDDMLGAVYQFGVPPDAREDEVRLLGLMALADRYELIAVRDECAACLQLRLTEANMATLLKVADLHQAAGLRTAALEFVTSRIERIAVAMDSDDPAVRRSIREHLAVSEELYRRHAAAAELKSTEVTLTV